VRATAPSSFFRPHSVGPQLAPSLSQTSKLLPVFPKFTTGGLEFRETPGVHQEGTAAKECGGSGWTKIGCDVLWGHISVRGVDRPSGHSLKLTNLATDRKKAASMPVAALPYCILQRKGFENTGVGSLAVPLVS
jgi:hypothetical protein